MAITSPWLWRPNWREGVRERLEWLTHVIRVWDGSEQRARLRQAPRQSWEYTVTASGDRRRALVAGATAVANGEVHAIDLPLWVDRTELTTAAAAGTTTLFCDTAGRAFTAGAKVLIGAQDAWALATVASVPDATRLTLTTPLAATWPVGTFVHPTRGARLVDAVAFTSHAPDVAEWRLTWQVIDTADPRVGGTAGPDTYWGLPVWPRRPNWGTGVRGSAQEPLQLVDGLTGTRTWMRRGGTPQLEVSHQYTAIGRASLTALRGVLYARHGQWAGCWLPSYQRDVRLSVDAAANATTLTVVRAGWAPELAGNAEHRHLQVVLWDGSMLYLEVTGATESGATEVFSLWSALPRAIATTDVRRISWMHWVRLASDQVEILYHTPEVAEMELTWTRPRLHLASELITHSLEPTQEALAQGAPAAPTGTLALLMPPLYAMSSAAGAQDAPEALAQTAPPAPMGVLADTPIDSPYDAGSEALDQSAPAAPTGSLT